MSNNVRPDDSPEAPHRQWNEILQETRVMQTGVQILAAFLVILPFQARFTMLTDVEEILYVILLVFSALLIVLMLVPVLVHRYLFGQRLKATTVLLGHRVVKVVGISAGLLVAGSVWFVIQVLVGWPVSVYVGGGLMLATLFLLVLLPRLLTPRGSMPESYDEG